MTPPDFERRLPAFREGFDGFFVGNLDNPYVQWRGTKPVIHARSFLASREWQHGQDVAFLFSQHFNNLSNGDYA